MDLSFLDAFTHSEVADALRLRGAGHTPAPAGASIARQLLDQVLLSRNKAAQAHPYRLRLREAIKDINRHPTPAQQRAGNYAVAHLYLHGLDVALENPRGGFREGTDQDGRHWRKRMAHHYGYIRRSEGKDGDQFDVFVGPHPESELVFIINQVDPHTRNFDEHKGLLGFLTEESAKHGYLDCYDEDWKGLGSIVAMTMPQFKDWIANGNLKKEAPEHWSKVAASILDGIKLAAEDEPTKEAAERPEVPSVAIDFDGTIAEYTGWHGGKIGQPRSGARKALEEFKREGYRIIIHTVRGDIEQVKKWLHDHDIHYDYINENPDQPPDSSDKLYARLYLDDRAIDARKPWNVLRKLVHERLRKKSAAEMSDEEFEAQQALKQAAEEAAMVNTTTSAMVDWDSLFHQKQGDLSMSRMMLMRTRMPYLLKRAAEDGYLPFDPPVGDDYARSESKSKSKSPPRSRQDQLGDILHHLAMVGNVGGVGGAAFGSRLAPQLGTLLNMPNIGYTAMQSHEPAMQSLAEAMHGNKDLGHVGKALAYLRGHGRTLGAIGAATIPSLARLLPRGTRDLTPEQLQQLHLQQRLQQQQMLQGGGPQM
jgi:hypothetical protein